VSDDDRNQGGSGQTTPDNGGPEAGPIAKPVRDGAYEIKFLLDHAVADEILNLARANMQADPNADPRLFDRYQINSLYFDNDQLDVFRRMGGFRKRKFRLRRYGIAPTLFVERKAKSRGIVRKRRTLIPEAELPRILETQPDAAWDGFWFYRRLVRRGLRPKVHIAYERIARVGMASDGPIRLTVDRKLVCRPESGASFPVLEQGMPLFTDKSILELKFTTVLPPLFNTIVREFALTPVSVSKYRTAIVACGLHVGMYGAAESSPEPDKDAAGAAAASLGTAASGVGTVDVNTEQRDGNLRSA